ncbi:MAG: TMEM175 family protein [Methanomassiliicoccus sp.]|nr:TMEM175 family protein [Methanomassiliicoccus sp.]
MEKKNIEELSNIIFGLALTVGTLTLVKPAEDSFGELLHILSSFALSFIVLLWFWWLYIRTMRGMVMNSQVKYGLNFVLLFLVVIEPYLLTIVDTVSGATAYAIDLGTVMVVFVFFWHFMRKETPLTDEARLDKLRRGRNSMLLSAAIFYASTLVQLFPPIASSGAQGLIWLFVLVVAMVYRLRE